MIVSEFVDSCVELLGRPYKIRDVVGHQRLTDVVLVRQTATLARTAASGCLVLAGVVLQSRRCALVCAPRVADRCVACPSVTESRARISVVVTTTVRLRSTTVRLFIKGHSTLG